MSFAIISLLWLVVSGNEFKMSLGMGTGRAGFGSCFPFMSIAAVATGPDGTGLPFEDTIVFDVFQELKKAFFVAIFGYCDRLEDRGNLLVTFLPGDLSETRVHAGMFVIFAAGSCLQIFNCRADPAGGEGRRHLDLTPFEHFEKALGVL
ncbi:MAG TPA: hypothetical protein VJ904_02940, partial [Tichowtungia sp.]|nr:hypothetical protein [Tichowtungia sp.]